MKDNVGGRIGRLAGARRIAGLEVPEKTGVSTTALKGVE
jgi:hypothetical protein